MEKSKSILVTGINPHLHANFKATCAYYNMSMGLALKLLMRQCVKMNAKEVLSLQKEGGFNGQAKQRS